MAKLALRIRTTLFLSLALTTAIACGDGGAKSTEPPGDGDAAGDGDKTGDGDAKGDGDATPDAGHHTASGTELPYTVDHDFVPAGYMGQAATLKTSLTALPNAMNSDNKCGGSRSSASAVGDCHTFTYAADPNPSYDQWAGVFWQFGDGNWTGPGLKIAAGAKEIHFFAKSDKAVSVKFWAGMKKPEGGGADGWEKTNTVVLGTAWKEYSIVLAGQDYSKGVTGAFAWAIDNVMQTKGLTGPYKLYVDDIQWR
jgi:hypothetical protein